MTHASGRPYRPDPGPQLVAGERLGDVVGGPDVEPPHLGRHVCGGGQEHDRDPLGPRVELQRSAGIDPVEHRHVQVEQDHVRPPLRRQPHGRRTVGRLRAGREPVGQALADHRADRRVVVGDQDVSRRRHHRSSSGMGWLASERHTPDIAPRTPTTEEDLSPE
jgi:hypothetical protein